MRVERIPTLRDNYTYLIVDEATGEAAVVDAPELAPVAERVDQLGVRVTKVLSTHHHLDHSGANPDLARRYGAPGDGNVSAAARIPGFTHGVVEGDRVAIGSLEAQVLAIPAHTRAHVAYVLPGAVFCGDTLFAAGCGRLFEGTPEMMHEALNGKLARLPDATLVYCGHEYTENNLRFAITVEPGNDAMQRRLEQVSARRARRAADWHDATPDEMTIPSTLGEERATNPFMRVAEPEIVEQILKRFPGADTDPATVLGLVRRLKDAF